MISSVLSFTEYRWLNYICAAALENLDLLQLVQQMIG